MLPCGASWKFGRKIALTCGASLEISSFFRSKPRSSRAEHPGNLQENRAHVLEHPQNFIALSFKTALTCGASLNLHRSFVQNHAPVRSVLKILMKIALPVWRSLKISSILRSKSRSPCGASSKFGRFFITYV